MGSACIGKQGCVLQGALAGKRPRAEEMRAAGALRAHPGAAAPRLQPCSELQGAPRAVHRSVPRKPSDVWCCVGGFGVLLAVAFAP